MHSTHQKWQTRVVRAGVRRGLRQIGRIVPQGEPEQKSLFFFPALKFPPIGGITRVCHLKGENGT